MTGNTLLEIFLYLQVFIAGALASIAVRYGYAHFRPTPPEPPNTQPPPGDIHLSPAARQHLLQASEAKFQQVVSHSASQLQHELESSGDQIKNLVNRMATEIVADEMQRYRTELAQARGQAHAEMGGISAEVGKYKEQIKAQAIAEIEAEKKALIKLMDTKLSDAMGSFLLEALGHNVDLGSQSAYLIATLEQHKADFIKGVVDETKTTG